MKLRRGHLTSIRFVTLYFVLAGAVVLQLTGERWGGRVWFPIAVGVVAAAGIIAVRSLLEDFLRTTSGRRGPTVVFFFFAAALWVAGFAFFIRTDPKLALGSLAMGGIFLFAALGTLNQWPGFRSPPAENECPGCRYDLTGNRSGVCPECGLMVSIVHEEDDAESADTAVGEDKLYFSVMILGGISICERCKRDASDDSPTFTDAAYKAQADRMRAEGWTSPDGLTLYCPTCSRRDSSPPL